MLVRRPAGLVMPSAEGGNRLPQDRYRSGTRAWLRALARVAVALCLGWGGLGLTRGWAQGAEAASDTAPSAEPLRARVTLSDIAGRSELVLDPALEVLRGQTSLGRGSFLTTLQRALENSYDLASVAARAQSQDAQVDVARGALRPRLDLRLGSGQELVRPGTGIDPVTGVAPKQSDHPRQESALVLRQSVFDQGLLYERDRQKSLSASNSANVTNTRHQVILDATAAHLDVLQYSLMVELARTYQVELDGLFQFVETRVSAGGASPVESERVNARSISARSAAIEANGLLESALLTYRRLVGAVPESLPTDDFLAPVALPSLTEALAQAQRSNPNLRALREQERALEFEGKSADARFLPKLELEVGNYQGHGTGGPSVRSNESRAMVVMTWNALNGGADTALARSAAARLAEARYRTKDMERRLEESLRIAYNTLDAVAQRTRSVRAELASNERVVTAFRTQLRSGNRQLLDVLDAEQRLYQSRVEVLRLTVMQANLTMQVLRQTGLLDPVEPGASEVSMPALPPAAPPVAPSPSPRPSAPKLNVPAAPVPAAATLVPAGPVPAAAPPAQRPSMPVPALPAGLALPTGPRPGAASDAVRAPAMPGPVLDEPPRRGPGAPVDDPASVPAERGSREFDEPSYGERYGDLPAPNETERAAPPLAPALVPAVPVNVEATPPESLPLAVDPVELKAAEPSAPAPVVAPEVVPAEPLVPMPSQAEPVAQEPEPVAPVKVEATPPAVALPESLPLAVDPVELKAAEPSAPAPVVAPEVVPAKPLVPMPSLPEPVTEEPAPLAPVKVEDPPPATEPVELKAVEPSAPAPSPSQPEPIPAELPPPAPESTEQTASADSPSEAIEIQLAPLAPGGDVHVTPVPAGQTPALGDDDGQR